ncbi:MAG: cyclopropane-fatty-acyl-phospholipid synthase [Planctomycetota bacterium]|jgi:cyclopropane-fatty-acyl-phospholipid synthase
MTAQSTPVKLFSEAEPTVANSTFLSRSVLAQLRKIRTGSLKIDDRGTSHSLGDESSLGPNAELRVHDARFWSSIAFRGSIGAGEAYARGWWTSPDAAQVVRLFVRNHEVLSGVDSGLTRLSRPFLRLYHALRSNSEGGSKSNISAHYDLSNDFFALFLDESMTYSCGLFESADTSLHEASIAKIDRLCKRLELEPSDHLIEVGTGWGAFAIHAATEYGCRVTSTTISQEQFDFATQRVRAAGLEDKVTILLTDYRQLEGQFDKLVSVEMIEAVGHRYYDQYFQCCASLLKPDGLMAIQAITIADQHYERARKSVDFIQRHIFPGSCIPSVTALCSSTTRASDLKLVTMEDIGQHYVTTISTWRQRLLNQRSKAEAMGFSTDFLRLWDFYFAYCEGGFCERHISTVQMLLSKPRGQASLALEPLRA